MGLKQGRGGKILSSLLPASPPFHHPSPLVFFVAFQDGGHDQCTSEFSLKKRLLCRLGSLGSAEHAKITINNFIMVYNPKYTRDHYHHYYYQICFGKETSRNHLRLITEATSIYLQVKEVLCVCCLKKIAGPHALWLSNFFHILHPYNFAF